MSAATSQETSTNPTLVVKAEEDTQKTPPARWATRTDTFISRYSAREERDGMSNHYSRG